MQYRIISIGTLSHHEFWQHTSQVRHAHATTILIESEGKKILVDPGLPPRVLLAHLEQHAGLSAEDIDMVFLTTFRPAHRMGLGAFPSAQWFISELERDAVGEHLIHLLQDAPDEESEGYIKEDLRVLKRCKPAPDSLAKHVDLFPLPGYSPGTCGLLLLSATATTLIASDAIATREHLQNKRVLKKGCLDREGALASLAEALEIADYIIPGHDNLLLCPKHGM